MPTTLPVNQIFTVGHSNHDMAAFLQILSDNSIQVVADVRSAPYSKYVPQFNKREIEKAACGAGFKYVFMGDVIGGKPTDPEFIDGNGKVMYDKIALSDNFQQGITRLTKGLQDGWLIALMCAEEDPFKCHRHLLIANELELNHNVPVWHIRSDGTRLRAKQCLNEQAAQLMLF